MPNSFIEYKRKIDAYLLQYLQSKKADLTAVNPWGLDTIDRLVPFTVSGKSVRGGLVLMVVDLYRSELSEDALRAASALELLHSGLLIHDDIMDRDALRRGNTSLYKQYENMGKNGHVDDESRFGMSMGINIGDACFFLAFELLGKIQGEKGQHVTTQISHALSQVTIAQMEDVASGHMPKKLSKEDILSLYLYKTARYSFSVPLIVGALIADAPPSALAHFSELGEAVGIIYQIRDDELNSQGDTEVTGKSANSDASNHKQTLSTLFDATELHALTKKFSQKAYVILQKLALDPTKNREFEELIEFCQNRTK